VTVNPVLDAIDRTGKATVYINFDTASSKIRPDSEPVIDTIFAMLQERPEMKLSIEGHTDGDGTAEGNQKLSEERAQAVQTALVGRGIVAARLRSKGHGMSMPVVDNTTEEGKAKNRRVELVKM
jgi:outer membrane protein OmpA-like peptidoglycan-associated protein